VDRESFKASNARLGVDFNYIFTAQDIGSYKPNLRWNGNSILFLLCFYFGFVRKKV
jgi:2-haloacid dehalogenase